MMNVLLPEINANPNRNSGAPSFQPEIEKELNEKTKENIIHKNDLDPRLFKDLGDEMDFDYSMRQFYTTANTKIPNDQKAFAEFCYGDMKSCKEGNESACMKNNPRIGSIIH